MNQQAIIDRPGGEERAARARIDAAAKLLRGDKSKVPDDFVALLFGRAAPEDLVALRRRRARGAGARGLGVSRRAQARRAENPLRAADAPDGERLKSISVIEIVNDDMPFLVDSVMAELTERGLVDAPGRASDPRGRARQGRQAHRAAGARRGNDKDETRESFIHIHVARVDDAGRRAEIVAGAGAGAGRGPALRAGLAADDPAASTR